MEYAFVGLVVLLVVAGFVTFFVLNAAKGGAKAEPADPGAEGNPADIAAPDPSPLGDTAEHSGGGTPESGEEPPPDRQGGEQPAAEGGDEKPRVGDPGPEADPPESERLADRSP